MSDDKDTLRGLKLLMKSIMPWRDFLYCSTAIFGTLLRMRLKYQRTHETLVRAKHKTPSHVKEFNAMYEDWRDLQKYIGISLGDAFRGFLFSFDFVNASEAASHLANKVDELNDEIWARMDEYAQRIEKLGN